MSEFHPSNSAEPAIEAAPETSHAASIAALPDFDAPKVRESGLGGVVFGGCMGGALLNIVLGFVLLALSRGGVKLYGPGVLAVVAACILLACVLREWPRRVMLGMGSVVLGMLLSYGALKLFVEPALRTVPDMPPSTQEIVKPRNGDSTGNS